MTGKKLALLAAGTVGVWLLVETSSDLLLERSGCSASKRAIASVLKAPSGVASLECRSATSNGIQTVVTTVDSRTRFGDIIRSQWVTTVRNDQVEMRIQVR
jgi:hypothetical protein